MKQRNLLTVLALAFLIFIAPCARAEETDFAAELLEKSGAEALYDQLDREEKELLSGAGIDGPALEPKGAQLLQMLAGVFREKLSAPFKALASLTAVAVLCKLGQSFGTGPAGDAVSLAASLACAVLAAAPILELMRSARQTVEHTGAFLLAAVPVYSGLMIASGNTVAGGSYSFLTLAAGNVIPVLASTVVFPLLHVLLLLALMAGVSGLHTEKLSASIYSAAKWMLVLAVSVFSGVLSLQTALNARVDAVGNKAAKLFASSAIPIVGGALGDAVAAIKNSVDLVKSGVGAFGILAALCILAPTAIEAALWIAVCSAGQIVGDLFEAPKVAAFLGACGNAAKMTLAVIASTGAVAVVSAAILLFVGSGL